MAAPPSSALVGTTCMELALEGERLCKTGDFKNGVKFFEEATKVGTDDERTLSAIYSQLGNAYFLLEDYQKALEYHKKDVNLVHNIGDRDAEGKACGNLGSTLKMLGKFDEAAVNCRRYLEICRSLQDEDGEMRALYNIGTVYHTQAKGMIGSRDPIIPLEEDELPDDAKSCLMRALKYYEMAVKVATKLNNFIHMGKAYGNLGNIHYILGNFDLAIENHKKRLSLARQTDDKWAERRATANLGNANIFLGNFLEAKENFSATMKVAHEIHDKYTEAYSCESLANTYTFMHDYKSALSHHLKFLDMIEELDDKLGEGRACWSLVNVYHMVGDPESALIYARKHHEIASQLGDNVGLATAKQNIEELEEIITQKQAANLACGGRTQSGTNRKLTSESKNIYRLTPEKRQEQEQRRFKKQLNSNFVADIDGLAARRRESRGERGVIRSSSSERLFDMIAHFQSGRIDDQRCEILRKPEFSNTESKTRIVDDKENLGIKTSGYSDTTNGGSTRATTGRGSHPSLTNPMNAVSAAASAIKATYRKASLAAYPTTSAPSVQSQRRPTVSTEHREQLFDLIAGAQGQRMDEQRASLPALTLANGVLKNPKSGGLLNRGYTIDQSTSSTSTGRRADVHDEKFLDSLMKYQSTRFNDQRSEIPDKEKGQADFFNLIVRFQSDRIDDQRSAPPAKNKNM